jgi:uncharacterized membrane protein YjjB (DUF3815 family)
MTALLPYVREFILAAVATLGFGLLFNVPRRALAASSMVGGLGLTVRMLAEALGAGQAGATYIGAVAIALAGYLLARRYRMPRMIFTVTGVIPMVPGVPAFSAMLEFASGNVDAGLVNTVQATLITGALAMGLTTVRVLSRGTGYERRK